MISQIIILINRLREIAYHSTEKKILANNASIKFKLGNPVRAFENISLLSFVISFDSNKVFFRLLKNTATRGKIKTKISFRRHANSNSCTDRSRKINFFKKV